MERLLEPPQAFDPASSQRRFTIAATDYMEFLLLPELSRLIEQVAPGIDIHIKRTESAFPLTQLENGSLDVVLGFCFGLGAAGPVMLRTFVCRSHGLCGPSKIILTSVMRLHWRNIWRLHTC